MFFFLSLLLTWTLCCVAFALCHLHTPSMISSQGRVPALGRCGVSKKHAAFFLIGLNNHGCTRARVTPLNGNEGEYYLPLHLRLVSAAQLLKIV